MTWVSEQCLVTWAYNLLVYKRTLNYTYCLLNIYIYIKSYDSYDSLNDCIDSLYYVEYFPFYI